MRIFEKILFAFRNIYDNIVSERQRKEGVYVALKGNLLTVNEVLEIAGISRYTLYRDSKNGHIQPIYFGKNVRYREEDVKEYAEKKKQSARVNFYKQKEKE